MGSATSLIVGGKYGSLWTAQEAEENEKAIEIQNLLVAFIAEHFFYGFPTRARKQSEDPLSSLWVEVAMEALKNEDKGSEDTAWLHDKVSSLYIVSLLAFFKH